MASTRILRQKSKAKPEAKPEARPEAAPSTLAPKRAAAIKESTAPATKRQKASKADKPAAAAPAAQRQKAAKTSKLAASPAKKPAQSGMPVLPAKSPKPPKPTTPEAVFASFADKASNTIEPAGVEALCEALGLDASVDRRVLLLAWSTNARRMGYFERDEWLAGMDMLRATSLESLRDALDALDAAMSPSHDKFESFYMFAFRYLLMEPGRKIIGLDDAREMLRLVFPKGTPHVEGFTTYMEQQTQYKTVNKDQWKGFHDFVQKVKEDCSNFDVNAAWPVIIDDYVLHFHAQHNVTE